MPARERALTGRAVPEVCSAQAGHNEAVRVVFDPARVSYEQLLRVLPGEESGRLFAGWVERA